MAVKTRLSTKPGERGTIVISVSFLDENNIAVIPKTLSKKLTDSFGNIIVDTIAINSGLASTMNFVWTGDQLAITGSDLERHFLLKGTYDSSNGPDLNFSLCIEFEIENFVGSI